MVYIQINIPEEVDKRLSLEKIKRDKETKSETIVEILDEVLEKEVN